MATFIAIGYGDAAGYERTDPSVRRAAHEHDARLRTAGALMGVAEAPVQVRNPEAGGTSTKQGRYMHSELPVAGFSVIEAEDMDAAVRLASDTPCAVAHGVVEVWPLKTS